MYSLRTTSLQCIFQKHHLITRTGFLDVGRTMTPLLVTIISTWLKTRYDGGRFELQAPVFSIRGENSGR